MQSEFIRGSGWSVWLGRGCTYINIETILYCSGHMCEVYITPHGSTWTLDFVQSTYLDSDCHPQLHSHMDEVQSLIISTCNYMIHSHAWFTDDLKDEDKHMMIKYAMHSIMHALCYILACVTRRIGCSEGTDMMIKYAHTLGYLQVPVILLCCITKRWHCYRFGLAQYIDVDQHLFTAIVLLRLW